MLIVRSFVSTVIQNGSGSGGHWCPYILGITMFILFPRISSTKVEILFQNINFQHQYPFWWYLTNCWHLSIKYVHGISRFGFAGFHFLPPKTTVGAGCYLFLTMSTVINLLSDNFLQPSKLVDLWRGRRLLACLQ